MAFETVPLYVDQARHEASVLRTLSYAAFSGLEGVVQPQDCKVVEGDTPGGFVNVLSGTVPILARGPGQQGESYVAKARTQTSVSVNPTDSSGARSDLIIVNVEDPADGTGQWPPLDPTQVETGPYVAVRVIQGVPPGTTSVHDLAGQIGIRNAVTLARLDIPASTATITTALIVDLRTLASPLTLPIQRTVGGPGLESTTSVDYVAIPSTAHTTVRVPEWATTMSLDVTCKPMRCYDPSSGVNNNLYGQCGVTVNGGTWPVVVNWWNHTFATMYSELWTGVAGTVNVTGYQGQDMSLQVVHSAEGGGPDPSIALQAYEQTITVFRIQFGQEPI